MITTAAIILILGSAVTAQHIGDQYYYDHGHNYDFQYSVHDPYHHDIKSQQETRIGDLVKGYYTLKETDGSTREVVYTADKHGGFNAIVTKDGHQVFPQITTRAQYAIPLYPHQQYRTPSHEEAAIRAHLGY